MFKFLDFQSLVFRKKVKDLSELYDRFAMELKRKFEQNNDFFYLCLEAYTKSLNGNQYASESSKFQEVKQIYERFVDNEKIDFDWMKKHLERMTLTGDLHIKLKEFMVKNKDNIKEFEFLYDYFPKVVKERIFYKVHCEYYKELPFLKKIVNTQPNPNMILNSNQIRQFLDQMAADCLHWQRKLSNQVRLISDFVHATNETSNVQLKVIRHTKMITRFSGFVSEEICMVKSFGELGREDPAKKHIKLADERRSSGYFEKLFENSEMFVENETLMQKIEWHPVFFQETMERPMSQMGMGMARKSSIKQTVPLNRFVGSTFRKEKMKHLIILVHGYGGSHYDMHCIKNYLSKIIPHSLFYSSSANEDMKKKTIQKMGQDLAEEVKLYTGGIMKLGKISFVGHSLGGVIIRSALQYLDELRPKMFTFVSLSSPHLGTLKNKSFLVNVGMGWLKNISKDTVITELQLGDKKKKRESFMYKLAMQDKLKWFSNIILFGSPQDEFVPYSSARIQPLTISEKNKNNVNQILYEMQDGIWGQVKNDMVVRVDVDLRASKK